MSIRIRPTTAPVGAVVTGLDMDDLSRAEACDLYQAFLRYAVLVFRGAVSTVAQHVKLSQLFGETDIHPIEHLRHKDDPRIIVLAANDGQSVAADDPSADNLVGTIPWHTDLMYTEVPTRGALLRAVKIPESGGNTGWIDTAGVYQRLPHKVKCKIQGLRIVHSYEMAHRAQSMVKGSAQLFPEVSHPLVYVHPENSLAVLNISPSSAKEITGLPQDEAQALLDALIALACRDEEAYIHHWEPGDVVLWDNWRTMHRAYGHLKRHPRLMHRTTLQSEMKLGQWIASKDVRQETELYAHG